MRGNIVITDVEEIATRSRIEHPPWENTGFRECSIWGWPWWGKTTQMAPKKNSPDHCRLFGANIRTNGPSGAGLSALHPSMSHGIKSADKGSIAEFPCHE